MGRSFAHHGDTPLNQCRSGTEPATPVSIFLLLGQLRQIRNLDIERRGDSLYGDPGRIPCSALDQGQHVRRDPRLLRQPCLAVALLLSQRADRLAERDLSLRVLGCARIHNRFGETATLPP
jgi:hypothetical protein